MRATTPDIVDCFRYTKKIITNNIEGKATRYQPTSMKPSVVMSNSSI